MRLFLFVDWVLESFIKTLLVMVISLALYSDQSTCTELSDLKIFDEQYPKAIYFRNVENSAANTSISYEKWAKRWSKLDGMVVKALDEEIPGRSKEAQKKFIQYKKDNPSKLMLLHFNGNARDPNFDFDAFHGEDWTYFVGTYSEGAIDPLDTVITVNDTQVFKNSDDIVIVPVNNMGELDWHKSEQVKLLSIKNESTITVERGVFSTKARSYKKNKAYLAAHVSQPAIAPGSSQALWRYNFSNTSNKDGMPERLAENLIRYLGEGGMLSLFDGVEFDVLADVRGLNHPSRKTPIDYNFDGMASKLDKNFQHQYRIGVYRFLTYLRKALGSEKLILADGNELNQQRAFGILNGIESETWPSHWDPNVEQWSSGINRHLFWKERSFSPSLNYIKIGKLPSKNGPSTVPLANLRRLRVAGALFTDSIISPAHRVKGKGVDKWPELTGQSREYKNWLGKASSEISYYSISDPAPVNYTFGKNEKNISYKGSDIHIRKTKNKALKFSLTFELTKVSDLSLEFTAIARSNLINKASFISITPNNSKPQQNMTWADDIPFAGHFYFKDIAKGKNTLTFETDAIELTLNDIKLVRGAELIYREFEEGVVIANPSRKKQKIALDKARALAPYFDKKQTQIIVPAKDALFLKKLTH